MRWFHACVVDHKLNRASDLRGYGNGNRNHNCNCNCGRGLRGAGGNKRILHEQKQNWGNYSLGECSFPQWLLLYPLVSACSA
jgi:hypothetical protein